LGFEQPKYKTKEKKTLKQENCSKGAPIIKTNYTNFKYIFKTLPAKLVGYK
jgi:hypothetical protein